jgi:hypothetical protein
MKQIRSLHRQGGWINFVAPLIAGGAALIGGSKAASAAKSAANTQAQSGQQALAQNQQFFDQTRSDLSPYRQVGADATGRLSDLMSSPQYNQGPEANYMPTAYTPTVDYQAYLRQNPDVAQYWANNPDERANYGSPEGWAKAHYENHGMMEGRQLPSAANFQFEQDPGYQFRLNEGNKAIGRATSTGALPSGGATLKALTRFGQDYASNEYGNAYGRFSNDRGFDYGRFMDDRMFDYGTFSDNYNRQAANLDRPFNYQTTLANMGQNAANIGAQSAGQFAGMNSQTITGMGNAKAAGTVGSANAWNQALGQIGNTAMDTMTLRTLMNGRNMNSPQNSGLQYFDTTALPSRRY